MKIIHYIPALSRRLGGVAMYVQLLAKELGKQCELIVVTRPFDNPLELENCRVINLPIKKAEFIETWKKVLISENPHLVHINGIWQLDTWWIQCEALRLGIKTYITPHGMLEPWSLQHNAWKKKLAMFLYEKKALRKAECLVATADSERANIKALNVNAHDVPIIPNGVDASGIPLKTDWTKKKKILYVSRLHVKKGIELLIDTAITIRDKLNDYEILIAGEGETTYVEKLKAKAQKSGLRIKFIGGVYGDTKWKLFQEADFFVLPTNSENFGYVIAEALGCGTPVITTKGAPWEDVKTWKCGYWIDRTEENLRLALLQMMSLTSTQLQDMGHNGRKLIEEKYSAKAMADTLMKIYN